MRREVEGGRRGRYGGVGGGGEGRSRQVILGGNAIHEAEYGTQKHSC